ncbi:MAG TPA: hypothetical protein PKL84_17580, partial [Candidatus Hydrogenedentes bacterium]|nr:hypothetical protein [Candidatus Hydrogenedentota bacterium]
MNWKMIAVMVALVTGAAALSGCPPNAIHSLTLIVSPAGTGQIIASPERAGYPAGTIITLEAVPAEGYQFRNWVGTGINNSINPTYLRIYADNTITAVFVREGGAEGEGEGETPPGVVRDGGFEAGSASPAWTQVSTAFEYLICDAAHCGTLDGLGPRSGQYWAYFGNAPDGESEAS